MNPCQEWLKDKNVNPRTNRKIKVGGPVYKKLEDECTSPLGDSVQVGPKIPAANKKKSSSPCVEWLKDKNVNPRTNRKIKVGGPVYKKLEDECTSPSGDVPAVNKKKSSSPCVEWLKDKNVNPRTNRKIKVGGPVYKKLEDECTSVPDRASDITSVGSISSDVSLSSPDVPLEEIPPLFEFPKKYDQCREWLKDKNVNPTTKRKMKVDGKMYQKFEKDCKGWREPKTSEYCVKGPDIKFLPKTIISELMVNSTNVDHYERMKINKYIDGLDLPLRPGNEKDYKVYGHALRYNDYNSATSRFNRLLNFIPNILYTFHNDSHESTVDKQLHLRNIHDMAHLFDLIIFQCFINSFNLVGNPNPYLTAETDEINKLEVENLDGTIPTNTFNVYHINHKKYYRQVTGSILVFGQNFRFSKKRSSFLKHNRYYNDMVQSNYNPKKRYRNHTDDDSDDDDSDDDDNYDDDGISSNDLTFSNPDILKVLDTYFTLDYLKLHEDDITILNEFYIPVRIENIDKIYYSHGTPNPIPNKDDVHKILKQIGSIESIRSVWPPKLNDKWYDIPKPIPFNFLTGLKFNDVTINSSIFSGSYNTIKKLKIEELTFEGLNTSDSILSNSMVYNTDATVLRLQSCNGGVDLEQINLSKLENIEIERCDIPFMDLFKNSTLKVKCEWITFRNNCGRNVDLSVFEYFPINRFTQELRIEFMDITSINFPDTFEYLNTLPSSFRLTILFKNCNITSLHQSLFTSNKINIKFERCPLSLTSIHSYLDIVNNDEIDYDGAVITFDIVDERVIQNNAGLLPLPQVLSNIYKSANMTGNDLSNITGDTCDSINEWLNRIYTEIQNNVKIIKDLTPHILNMLEEMNTNEEFRDIACAIIYGATGTCGDRMILSILYVSLQFKIHQLAPQLDNIQNIYELLIRGPFVMSLLEKVARQKVSRLMVVDEIEVYLAYPIKLRDRFRIPIETSEMLYYMCSSVNTADLQRAQTLVEEKLKNKKEIINFLQTQTLWNKLLFEVNPDLFDDTDNLVDNSIKETIKIIDAYNLLDRVD